jgi:hypothetical protein
MQGRDNCITVRRREYDVSSHRDEEGWDLSKDWKTKQCGREW